MCVRTGRWWRVPRAASRRQHPPEAERQGGGGVFAAGGRPLRAAPGDDAASLMLAPQPINYLKRLYCLVQGGCPIAVVRWRCGAGPQGLSPLTRSAATDRHRLRREASAGSAAQPPRRRPPPAVPTRRRWLFLTRSRAARRLERGLVRLSPQQIAAAIQVSHSSAAGWRCEHVSLGAAGAITGRRGVDEACRRAAAVGCARCEQDAGPVQTGACRRGGRSAVWPHCTCSCS
jgi:hypothetical protein